MIEVLGTSIETFSGRQMEPLNPKIEDIAVEDIAHALSMQCRFTGHTRLFYSVAEHCVRVSILAAQFGRPEDALWGLLHDASEAYLHDIASPIKHQPEFALYREAEKVLEELIFERYGLHGPRPQVIKKADLILLATEARDLMPMKNQPKYGPEVPLSGRIKPWSPRKANLEYLNRFHELTGDSK
jgi:hypothetical protein